MNVLIKVGKDSLHLHYSYNPNYYYANSLLTMRPQLLYITRQEFQSFKFMTTFIILSHILLKETRVQHERPQTFEQQCTQSMATSESDNDWQEFIMHRVFCDDAELDKLFPDV